MSLLDEAIREHLELKRRRGADPTEVERLEREALGPVRRVGQEPSAELSAPDEQAEPLFEEEVPIPAEHFGGEPEQEHAEEPALSTDYEAETAFHDVETAFGDEPAHGVTPTPEPPHHGEPAAVPPAEHGPETAEFDVEAEHAAEEGEREDMLEETPEFLQDTPEHDRLWFEQRPPKDFDFEG